ncbi:MAG: SAM-dependent methyltransferase [Alphaproteobacteria bacterium]|nr:SAM-dependent methyltransferase [Alphaproteobacteria bacterium]
MNGRTIDGVTHDAFLGGAVTVVQPETGYRAGLDAVLLAASLRAVDGETLAEAGTGSGAALLCAARRLGGVRFQGFERDPSMAALANDGVGLNAMGDRVKADVADIGVRAAALENAFDQAFANPPYFEPGSIRPPGPGRASAYVADTPLKAWILFLLHVTRAGGRITLIHRAAALADLLELLAPRAGEIEVLPVRPAPGRPASRVLVAARKGLRRGPATLYEGLTLHEAWGGQLTQRAADALAGSALEWR